MRLHQLKLAKDMDLDKVCRMCSSRTSHLRSMFVDYAEHNLVQIVVEILQLEIYRGDGLPPNICASCADGLLKLRDSIRAFRENDKAIRTMISEHHSRNVVQYPLETTSETKPVKKQKNKSVPAPIKTALEGVYNIKVELSTDIDHGQQQNLLECLLDPSKPVQTDLKCYICQSESMDTAHTLFQHLASHAKLLPYKCPDCKVEPVLVHDVQSLNNHRKMHTQSLNCDYCDQRFSDISTLLHHLKTFHLPENASCVTSAEMPGQQSQEDWREQFTVMQGPAGEVYTCKLCGKTFTSMRSVKYHVKNHYKNIKCDRCDLRFVSESKLRTHYAVHTGIRQHKCEICNKEFLWKNNLTQHLKLHTNERNFACEFCGKLFTYREGMKSHVRFNHLAESPYECIACRQKFVDNASLARHVAAEHQPVAVQRALV